MSATLLSSKKTYGGLTQQWSHESSVLGNNAEGTPVVMKFSVFLPPNVSEPVPVLYWLSGLTCTDENFITKVSGQRVAAQVGIALVCPDTSPRSFFIQINQQNINYIDRFNKQEDAKLKEKKIHGTLELVKFFSLKLLSQMVQTFKK